MWASRQKPNVDLLMQNCNSQLLEYENNDLQLTFNEPQICVNIHRQMFIADLPAKCLFMKSINYNGYSACTVCMSKGKVAFVLIVS